MIKRVFWLGVGVAVGVLVVRKLTRTAQAFTPRGIAGSARQSAVGVADSLRSFVDDVRAGMTEREAEIHAALAAGATLDDDLSAPTWEEEGDHR